MSSSSSTSSFSTDSDSSGESFVIATMIFNQTWLAVQRSMCDHHFGEFDIFKNGLRELCEVAVRSRNVAGSRPIESAIVQYFIGGLAMEESFSRPIEQLHNLLPLLALIFETTIDFRRSSYTIFALPKQCRL